MTVSEMKTFETLKEAIEYGLDTKAKGVVEKGGKYKVAKSLFEINHSEEYDWI